MRYSFLIWIAALLQLQGAEYHISPNGNAEGNGSEESPWDLQTALNHPDVVQPGDTLWLHGGDYVGSFESVLTGESGNPIVVRQAPGEHARICVELIEGKPPGLYLKGEHARFQGFEITCLDPKRSTKLSGSWPEDVRRGSVEIRGNHIEAVNLIVHDLGNGFGFWSQAEGGQIYGCLIYHNGWIGPDRGHGHAIYTQNERSVKKITDCLIYRQFGSGIHLYGSGNSSLRGFRIDGVAAFDQSVRGGGRNLLVGGGASLDDIRVSNCYTWDGGIQLGYASDAKNRSVVAENNYIAGGIRVQYPGTFTIRNNTLVAPAGLLIVQLNARDELSKLKFSGNTFHRTGDQWQPFQFLAPEGNQSGDLQLLEDLGFAEG
ncbi:MAG: right-handed parallel beta-helix repeat-containing protein, partial [Verrucomicrobiota bacterium]